MQHNETSSLSFFAKMLTVCHWMTNRTFRAVLVAGTLLPVTSFGLMAWVLPRTDGKPLRSAAGDGPGGTELSSSELANWLTVSTQELRKLAPATREVEYTGVVSSTRTSRLSNRSLALVEKIHVDLGDKVSKGQVLVELEHEQLKARRAHAEAELARGRAILEELVRGPRSQEIEQARAKVTELTALLALRQATLARSERLRQSLSISQQEYEESKAAFDAGQAQLDGAKHALSLLEEGSRVEQIAAQEAVVQSLTAALALIDVQIRESFILAPYDGVVQKRFADEGTVVAPGEVILEIIEAPNLEISVGLPSGITMGNISEAHLRIDGNLVPVQPLRISPQIDLRTRTREVLFGLSGASPQPLIPGQAVTIVLQTQANTVGWWIPTSALVVAERGLWSVFIAVPTDDQEMAIVERVQVELLGTLNDWSQIQGPLTGDEKIIVDGLHRLAPGQKVRLLRAKR